MWALVAAIALTYGLVRAAAAEPDRREGWQRRKLAGLARSLDRGHLTPDQAADGEVLARRFQEAGLAKKFRAAAGRLKQKRKE
jgi:hypothetical protein